MNRKSANGERARHLVVIDGYHGHLEFLEDQPAEQAAAQGLGLPLAAIAEALECRITLCDWSDWQDYEQDPSSFANWMPFPATRPLDVPAPASLASFGGRIRRCPIPARDPEHGRPFAAGLSSRSYGLLAESDPLFLASFVLNQFLEQLAQSDPFDLVILPMFGGVGYVAQLSRATGAGLRDARFAAVVTGTSACRQIANGEGLWTRPAITRRQMEDLSLGLADLAITFGPRGRAVAEAGRSGAIVEAPRRVSEDVLNGIRAAATANGPEDPISFFIHEPLQAASGTLLALDAARTLMLQRQPLQRAIACSGTAMRFAPALPKDFRSYWSSRGWAKELVEEGYWTWAEVPPVAPGACRVRLCPSAFEHLPALWQSLADGCAVVVSAAAAEGLAAPTLLPKALLLDDGTTPEQLAARLIHLESLGGAGIDKLRVEMCDAVLSTYGGPDFESKLGSTVGAIRRVLAGEIIAPSLDQAARRLLDGRPGATIARDEVSPPLIAAPATLTVAIPCFEMGSLVIETVESVWASERLPDEVLLIDDGSRGAETAEAIGEIVSRAKQRGLPMTLIRQVNQGLASARNTALAAARSGYISFIDGDDLIDPRFYRLALDLLATNPGLGGVAAWAETFGVGVEPGFWNAPQPELPLLLAENTVFVPCMSPVALLRRLGGYDIRQRFNYEDWELAIRIVAAGYPIVTIPRYLQRYRVRADSLLRTMSDVQNQVMREELFHNHRSTIEKFGPELAAQIEHRLMRALGRQSEATPVSGDAAIQALRGHAQAGVRRSMASWKSRLQAIVNGSVGQQ
ncbi:MAG: glycosyltransferase family A protein [Novosphingobium sp.]